MRDVYWISAKLDSLCGSLLMISLVTYRNDPLKWQQTIKAGPLILGGKSHRQIFKKLSCLCLGFLTINNFDTDVRDKQPTAFKHRREEDSRAHMCMDKASSQFWSSPNLFPNPKHNLQEILSLLKNVRL